jgi:hypothetical protein
MDFYIVQCGERLHVVLKDKAQMPMVSMSTKGISYYRFVLQEVWARRVIIQIVE